MTIYKKIIMSLKGGKHEYVPIMVQQTDFLRESASLLAEVFASPDNGLWERNEKKIKSCEVQGDALLTEFHEMLSGSIMVQVNKLDLQSVSMAIDDCLDALRIIVKVGYHFFSR